MGLGKQLNDKVTKFLSTALSALNSPSLVTRTPSTPLLHGGDRSLALRGTKEACVLLVPAVS